MTARPTTPSAPTLPRREIDRAAAALADGRLVILPTETVYGLFGSAASRAAVDRLLALAGPPAHPNDPLAWHSHDAALVRDLLAFTHPVHRRLARRLMPGPVTWIVEGRPEAAAAVRARLAPVEGAIVTAQAIAVRVPDHPIAAAVIGAAGVPIVARSVTGAGWGNGATLPAGLASAPPESVAAIIDTGPTRFGRASTTIRLGLGGSFAVEPGGALEERFILKLLERNILFVCTGNTCRSPMAAAIARSLLAALPPDGITTKVRSAGTFVTAGQPATPEADLALHKLGIEPARHASTEIDWRAITEADAIFTMTREHADAVLALDPSASAKVKTLDPSGRSIPDPIGGAQDVYDRAASHIRDLLSVRLRELEP